MTSRDFVYWMQGLFELSEVEQLNKKQTDLIKRHLNMVFKHDIDPSMGDSEHQGKLNALHQGLEDLVLTGVDSPEDPLPELPDTQTGTMSPSGLSTAEGQHILQLIADLNNTHGLIARC